MNVSKSRKYDFRSDMPQAARVESVSNPRGCSAHILALQRTYAWIDSEMVPIWLILSNNPLQAVFSMAVLILEVLVTVKSSPTIWICEFLVKCDQASQSSWSKGSCGERSEAGQVVGR
jgi:hypothetical protein